MGPAQAAIHADASSAASSRGPATTPRQTPNSRPATHDQTVDGRHGHVAIARHTAKADDPILVDSNATNGDWEKDFLKQDQWTPCKPRTS